MPNQSNKRDFREQLISAGFIKNVHILPYTIDKAAACAFLCVSPSTLKRWLRFNDACPRAIKLLERVKYTLPDSWEGCTFYRNSLYTPFNQKGIDLVHIAFLSSHAATIRELKTTNMTQQTTIDALGDKQNIEAIKKRIENALSELNKVMSEPILKTPRKVR